VKPVFLTGALLFLSLHAKAQLQFVPPEAAQTAFADGARAVKATFHNPENQPLKTPLRLQLFQASSATVVPLGRPRDWKTLEVLPGQTVLESAAVTFPAVRNGSRFLVQWLDAANKVLGRTDVMVYPTNLLEALKPLAGETPLGVFDPQDQLKPLLKGLAVEFDDLAEAGLDSFSGKLAIIGPFQSRTQMREGLSEEIQALAKKGKAIVWIQAPSERGAKLKPTFYAVPQKEYSVMIVQPGMVANLPENPQSQLNLVRFCQLALHPEIPAWPTQTR